MSGRAQLNKAKKKIYSTKLLKVAKLFNNE